MRKWTKAVKRRYIEWVDEEVDEGSEAEVHRMIQTPLARSG